LRPLKYSAVRRSTPGASCTTDTTAEVNTPVRWSPSGRSIVRILTLVSSLWNNSPCAAWRINSSRAGSSSAAASSTISHWVAAGSGTPNRFSRFSIRLKGTPLPYFSCATIAEAVSSYFSGPTPSGSGAVNSCPQALQRNCSSS